MSQKAMTQPDHFEFVDGIAVFRPVGQHPLQHLVKLVRKAIVQACVQRIGKLLIVTTDVTGFNAPGLAVRHSMVREWASAANGQVSIAMVARPEFIDPNKFGVTVAMNFGLVGDVFETEEEAMAWLRSLG
jgi:hypothetical protein